MDGRSASSEAEAEAGLGWASLGLSLPSARYPATPCHATPRHAETDRVMASSLYLPPSRPRSSPSLLFFVRRAPASSMVTQGTIAQKASRAGRLQRRSAKTASDGESEPALRLSTRSGRLWLAPLEAWARLSPLLMPSEPLRAGRPRLPTQP
ncbi:uncharacterized protein PSFLO_04589 [Pseudozyma flocculosa]|uniref:Uncharacterized protein n=1 Tax=Pseudozyma flocculosa TaxID=84751 RepID=A0A5C3F4Q6_9BASI|nr:uncharacterized protein PSFLO_04589 [Pseudozyma flocculosa]